MTQQNLFSKPPKPITILDMFSLTRQGWLEECRKTAKQLLRNGGVITIEDVLMLVPRPTYLHRNVTGRVFDNQFKPVGFVRAKHEAAKGRYIRTWQIK